MAQSWQAITRRLQAAFAGAYDTVESVANATGATLSKRPPETEATEYEQIAARVEWIDASLTKINDALADDADDESPEANALAVDTTAPAGPTTRAKSAKASKPAATPTTTADDEQAEG